MEKTNVLWFSDTPTVETGFGQVAKQLLKHLYATGQFDFTIWGINYTGDQFNKEKFPYTILPASGAINGVRDLYGVTGLAQHILSGKYKILFTLNDFQVLNAVVPHVKEAREKGIPIKWIVYVPLDAPFMSKNLGECLIEADYAIVYTRFEYDQIVKVFPELKNKLKIIYHGTEPETFFPLPKNERHKLRKKYFNIDDTYFLVINVNRNQWRKDLARTMYVVKSFQKKYYAKTILYLHAKTIDVGGNLLNQAATIGYFDGSQSFADLVVTPPDFNPAYGVSRETLNEIYNCADVLISTTLGEGWGLSLTEAMCAKVPVLAPNNTSITEIIGANEERGWLAPCGTTSSEWMVAYGHSDFMRPIVNVDGCVEKLREIFECPLDKKELKLYNAKTWAFEHTWAKIGLQWKEIFEAAKKE